MSFFFLLCKLNREGGMGGLVYIYLVAKVGELGGEKKY